MENSIFAFEEEIKIYKERIYLKELKNQNEYKKIKKNIFSFNGLWSNNEIFYNNDDDNEEEEENGIDEPNNEIGNNIALLNNDVYKNKYILKYKLINHYGKIPFRPILCPIYDINSYLTI